MQSAVLPSRCPNCANVNVEKFCPGCGQEVGASVGPVREMALDAAGEFLHWDGKLIATLKGLLRPGLLTTEYLAGRRAAYITPLRLYLWVSALYFLLFSSSAHLRQVEQFQTEIQSTMAGMRAGQPTRGAQAQSVNFAAMTDPSTLSERQKRKIERLSRRMQHLTEWIVGNMSTLTFLSLPITALLLHLFYRRQRRYYAAQLITVLHVESALLLAVMPLLLVPQGQLLKTGATMAFYPVYYYFALRRVYGNFAGQSVGKTVAKTLLFLAASGLTLMVGAMLGGMVIAALTLTGRM